MEDRYIGEILYDYNYDKLKVKYFSNRYKAYLLSRNGEDNGLYIIMKKEELERLLQKQPKIKKNIEESRKSDEEEKRKEAKEKFEYENTYGFTNRVSDMQKGRILKILNVKYHYREGEKDLGIMSRKDFILLMIREKGYLPIYKENIKYWTKNGVKIKNEYRLVDSMDKDSFYIITKTEYDYGNYINNNVLQKK